MAQTDGLVERAAQKRLVRKYKALGYDVHESPGPDRLPDFMQGAAPDIVARSPSDNVVIEVRRHAALKGSNDIVGMAERVSNRPDWRLELVVLADERNEESSSLPSEALLERVEAASNGPLFDVAFVYVASVMVAIVRALASKSGLSMDDKADKVALVELGFRGVLPGDLVDSCLAVLSMRHRLAHNAEAAASVSGQDVKEVVKLLDDLWAFQ